MRFDKRYLTGLTVGAIFGGVAAFATATAQQTDTFSEEHLQYTRSVIDALQVYNSFDQILPTMADQTRTLFVRNNPALAAEIETSVNDAALSLVDKRKQLDEQVLRIWARRFSTEEIKAIADFFNSPAGRAFASQSGALLQDSAVAAKAWGDERSVEIVDLVREDLRRRGHLE